MTLVEKLIVALIIGILSAIGVPGWLGFVAAQEVKVAADEVQAAIVSAREEAKLKKLMSNYLLLTCQTDYECNIADQMDSVIQIQLSAQMDTFSSVEVLAPSVKFHNYLQSISPVGLRALILPVTQPILDQSVLPVGGLVTIPASSYLPFSVLPDAKQTKDAKANDAPKHRGTGRRDEKATKKPKKSSLALEGCFQDNGLFLLKTANGNVQVNWATIPDNTKIKTNAPLCRAPKDE